MKQLYRLENDRKIAGVCSGLGQYLELDPVIVRLFFLFSIFFGGLGMLAYIVMWIVVPLENVSPANLSPRPRLQLSNTDRKIAGVCGGLGEHFALDPVLFRVMFLVLAFTCGAGILLYVVLWLLVPRASLPATGANSDTSVGTGPGTGGATPQSA